ncbi:hypothetical protein GP5015_1216 [gamma proteobacterium HTCC5015]|nr:hypothetical protein GP5015_1216 [gamma proteobacterium HTCC5015]
MALAMPKHSQALLGKKYCAKPQLLLRLIAISVMALAVWLSVRAWGISEGVIAYTVALFLPGLAVVMLLSIYSRKR